MKVGVAVGRKHTITDPSGGTLRLMLIFRRIASRVHGITTMTDVIKICASSRVVIAQPGSGP